jgi:hypothetical protein
MNRLIQSAMLIVAVTSASAWAQGKLDATTMKAFGGTYQLDCSNNASRCDGTAKPMQTAAAAPVAGQAAPPASQIAGTGNSAKIFKGYALTQLSASGLLYNAKAKEIYYKALGPLVKEPWLAKLDGPSSEGQAMKGANDDYVMLYTCKDRDCYDNNVVLLWSGLQNVVYGKVNQKGKSTLIGGPPPAVAAELEKIWKKQFRSQPK